VQPARPDARRDKALSKTLLAGHRVRVPEFMVVRRGRKAGGRSGSPSRSS